MSDQVSGRCPLLLDRGTIQCLKHGRYILAKKPRMKVTRALNFMHVVIPSVSDDHSLHQNSVSDRLNKL